MPKIWRGLTGTFREKKNLRNLKLPDKQLWYMLWAPAGFGGTITRAKEVQEVLKLLDPEAIAWYPLIPQQVGNRTYMKAVYAGYMFVFCKWAPEMDDLLKEYAPAQVMFLKDEDTLAPLPIRNEDIEIVKAVVTELEAHPEKLLDIEGLIPGESVEIVKKQFLGSIGKIQTFLEKNRVIVEMSMFQRTVPVVFNRKDLKPV